MNKEQLLVKLNYLLKELDNKDRIVTASADKQSGKRLGLLMAISQIDKLDEPEKVVVSKMEKVVIPQFVADWIERSKQKGHKLVNAMLYFYVLGIDSDDVNKYINKNYETFVRAWLDGYTIIPERNMQVIIKSYDKIELEIELPESEANELIEKLRGVQ